MLRPSRVSAREGSAGPSRCSRSFIFFEGAHSHADHLPESNHCAKQQPDQKEPLNVQPVIDQLAQKEAPQDRRRNNTPTVGIASHRPQTALLLPELQTTS